MTNIYENGDYLESTRSWHQEDSHWKATHIASLLEAHSLTPAHVIEVGCGAGGVLAELSKMPGFSDTTFVGYDISPQAIAIASKHASENLLFEQLDFVALATPHAVDVLLAIDVFEHVPHYWSFLEQIRTRAAYKLFHIPLDIHVSSVLRGKLTAHRYDIGHIHYFTAESALAVLTDCGYEVLDHRYTNGAVALFRKHPSWRRALANGPRTILGTLCPRIAARWLGGYSLLVLAR
jgi:SAM-dependent methyltransferase